MPVNTTSKRKSQPCSTTNGSEQLCDRIVELLQKDQARFEQWLLTNPVDPFRGAPLKRKNLNEPFPKGVSQRKLDAFAKANGIVLSDSLQKWLQITNGAAGFFGVSIRKKLYDIKSALQEFPKWRKRNWIPVAYDVFGNYYVQPNSEAVCFVESLHTDEDTVNYVIASDMLQFALHRLEEDFGIHAAWRQKQLRRRSLSARERKALQHPCPWPFHKKYTLELDPALKSIREFPLPWKSK